MGIFKRKTPFRKEVEKLEKDEIRLCNSRMERTDSKLNQFLENKVPEKLSGTLDKAFAKAFWLIFEKGTVVIEKTYNKDQIERDYVINEFNAEVNADKKSLRQFSKEAGGAGRKNLVISGAAGIGMGLIGVGIPDIPVFTTMLLRSVYEIALSFGFEYDTDSEKCFILALIQGALSFGEEFEAINHDINMMIETGASFSGENVAEMIEETAKCMSGELLYMKFLQGLPIVGVVGGAYDVVYMKRITEYSELKYRRRFLYKMIKDQE